MGFPVADERYKGRRVEVYCSSEEQKARWGKHADERDKPLATFVREVVNEWVHDQENDQSGPAFEELREELDEARETVDELRQRLDEKDALIKELEEDLRRYRSQAFNDPNFQGTREYNPRLIEFLRGHRKASGDPKAATQERILRELGVAEDDADTIQSIAAQLKHLKNYGLVESTPDGWRWEE